MPKGRHAAGMPCNGRSQTKARPNNGLTRYPSELNLKTHVKIFWTNRFSCRFGLPEMPLPGRTARLSHSDEPPSLLLIKRTGRIYKNEPNIGESNYGQLFQGLRASFR
jgi:hypothetical protein